MEFNLEKSLDILQRTPEVLHSMLSGLSPDWTSKNEGGESWSAYDVVGHLIHGEITDWVPGAEVILSGNTDKTFTPFDRFAQFEASKGKSLMELLKEFSDLRKRNIDHLRSKKITAQDLGRTGIHPAFGQVTLSQLLSTWVVHDLNHIAQIARVMGKQYKGQVGPWVEYLRILNL